jgi:hypothetical protein
MGDIIGRGQAYEPLTTRTGALGNWLNLLLFIGIVGLLRRLAAQKLPVKTKFVKREADLFES